MSFGKYLVNGAVLGALLSLPNTIRRSKRATSGRSTALLWLVWAGTLVVALGSVALRERERHTAELEDFTGEDW